VNIHGVKMKLFAKFKFTLSFIILIAFSIYIYAFSGGITGVTQKNGNGCTCHGSQSAKVSVVIDGPETMAPGQTENFTLTITGGPLTAGGTNIASSAGELIAGVGTQLLGNELTHTQPKTSTAEKVVFPFSFTAPTSEMDVTLYANGNSVNLNGSNSGDQWNFAPNKTISVKNPTDVEEIINVKTFSLSQNYPNPFNPTTTIKYSIPVKVKNFVDVKLKIYDLLGREVGTLVNEPKSSGNYEVNFNASELSSGVYYYTLNADDFSVTKKMILLK